MTVLLKISVHVRGIFGLIPTIDSNFIYLMYVKMTEVDLRKSLGNPRVYQTVKFDDLMMPY